MAPSEKRPWTCLPLDSDLSLSWEQWGGWRAGGWQRWTWWGGDPSIGVLQGPWGARRGWEGPRQRGRRQ